MLHAPEYIQSLIPYQPGKPIEETKRELGIKRVIKLASNENPLGPSPKAVVALRKAAKELHRYPDGAAYRLKHALMRALDVKAEQLLIGNGSNEIIDMLVRTYCLPGDAIVTSQAAFVAYRLCAQIHGVTTHETPLRPDYRFDLSAMAEQVSRDERARIVFLPNPNNPTGTYVTTTELRAFLKRVASIRRDGVLVALDYAYWEYVTAPDLPDPLALMREFPNVVVLKTFSKIYGLAGLRVGYAVGAPELIGTVEKIRQPFNINSPGLAAAEAALGDTAFVKRARRTNIEGMRFWEHELRRMGIPFWTSQGNFLLVDTGAGLGKPGAEVYRECLKRGVIFRPVANYGLPHALRISVGTMAENRLAMKALQAELPRGRK